MVSRGKKVADSHVEVTHIVQPPDINSLGTIFGGRVMEWIDLAAAACAARHARRTCVTASMDAVHFISPIQLGEIVIVKAHINYTHTTSMEIGVRVDAENPLTGEHRHAVSAYLTFVAIDEKRRPISVPAILPQSRDEKRRFQEGEERRAARLAWKKRRGKQTTS